MCQTSGADLWGEMVSGMVSVQEEEYLGRKICRFNRKRGREGLQQRESHRHTFLSSTPEFNSRLDILRIPSSAVFGCALVLGWFLAAVWRRQVPHTPPFPLQGWLLGSARMWLMRRGWRGFRAGWCCWRAGSNRQRNVSFPACLLISF